jgi:hypothetical protein
MPPNTTKVKKFAAPRYQLPKHQTPNTMATNSFGMRPGIILLREGTDSSQVRIFIAPDSPSSLSTAKSHSHVCLLSFLFRAFLNSFRTLTLVKQQLILSEQHWGLRVATSSFLMVERSPLATMEQPL